MKSITGLRTDYSLDRLSANDLARDPFEQFENWFEDAVNAEILEPNAMCLATVGPGGQPSTRIVLLKDFSKTGLTFFTNYQSRKAQELEHNENVSVNFLWLPLQRQINIAGRVCRLSKADTLKYFLSRPFSSQLGAWSSPQSTVISSRQIIEEQWEKMKRKYSEGEVPLPDHWGGYRIVPNSFEYWQGRPNRLHDRFVYSLDSQGTWVTKRLAP